MENTELTISISDMERAWDGGGTRRVGKIQVIDKIDNPYFKAFDFVVINTEGLYRMQHNKTTNEVILYRKVERVESVTRWIPIIDQNVSKTVGRESEVEGGKHGANGSVGEKDNASVGDSGRDGEDKTSGDGNPEINSPSST